MEAEAPDQPTDLPRHAWPGVLKRTLREFNGDHLTDLAAALTYYGVLAIFPDARRDRVAARAARALGHAVADQQPGQRGARPAKQIFTSAIQNVQHSQGTAGVAFVVGPGGGTVVGVRLRRGVHARLQRRLGRGGGPSLLQDAAHPAGGDLRDGRAPHAQRRCGRVHGGTGAEAGQPDRRRLLTRCRCGTSPSGRCWRCS